MIFKYGDDLFDLVRLRLPAAAFVGLKRYGRCRYPTLFTPGYYGVPARVTLSDHRAVVLCKCQ